MEAHDTLLRPRHPQQDRTERSRRPRADEVLRAQLVRLLQWQDAHVSLESAVRGLPPELRGERPGGAPHSPWELLEHVRLTQRDILEFCGEADYQERAWPDAYWPELPAPPDERAWERSLRQILHDREQLLRLAKDPRVDLFAPVPHGSGRTYLRELLLVADHTSYHVGQMVLVRRLLGAWPQA